MKKQKIFDVTSHNKILINHNKQIINLFSVIGFLTFFVLSLIALFDINRTLLSNTLQPGLLSSTLFSIAWKIGLVSLIWFSSILYSKNIKKTFSYKYFSFLYALAFIIIVWVVFFYYMSQDITSFIELTSLIYLLFGAVTLSSFWKVLFSVLNWRTNPFLARKEFIQAISILLFITILGLSSIILEDIFILKKTFNFSNVTYFVIIVICSFSLVSIIIFKTTDLLYFSKFNGNKDLGRHSENISSFLKILSVTVWYFTHVPDMNFDFNIFYIFAIGVLTVGINLFMIFRKGGLQGSSRLFTSVWGTSIFILISSSFILLSIFDWGFSVVLVALLPSFLALSLVNILVRPKMKYYLKSSFGTLNWSIAITVIIIWAAVNFLGDTILDIANAVFSLKILICLELVLASLYFQLALVFSLRRDVIKGYKSSKRLEKKNKKIQKQIMAKELEVRNE